MQGRQFDIQGRILTAAIVVSLAAAFIFLLLDLFYFEDFYSSIIELGSILILSAFFVLSLKKNLKKRLIIPYVAFIFIALDFGWYFGGGLNLSMSLLMLLAMLASLIMLQPKHRRWFLALTLTNLLILVVAEYQFTDIREINTNVYEVLVSSHIVIAITFVVGLLMMSLFLTYFDKARSVISNQNQLLKIRAEEMQSQNELLKKQKSEILKQQTDIESKNMLLLKRTEEKFFQIFHTTPNIISITRLSDGVFIDVNNSYAELVGFHKNKIIGNTAAALNIFNDPEEVKSILASLKGERQIRHKELMLRTRSGIQKRILYSVKVIDIDNVECALFIGDDITDRKLTEEELKKSFNQIERYARKNSHEVRAPLTRLMGLVELMKGTKDANEQDFIREEIINSAEELDRIVHEINEILETSQKS